MQIIVIVPGAHPRVSGENSLIMSGPGVDWGSSPRERGKPNQLALNKPFVGLIPA